MKEIELTRGYVALVDDHMFDLLSQYRWHAHVMPYTVYARCNHKGIFVHMHNIILPPTEGMSVDHIDGNGIHNLCNNLRLVTASQQQINRIGWGAVSAKGVCQNHGRWRARITTGGVCEELGTFDTMEEAANAYKIASSRLHGEFARGEKKTG